MDAVFTTRWAGMTFVPIYKDSNLRSLIFDYINVEQHLITGVELPPMPDVLTGLIAEYVGIDRYGNLHEQLMTELLQKVKLVYYRGRRISTLHPTGHGEPQITCRNFYGSSLYLRDSQPYPLLKHVCNGLLTHRHGSGGTLSKVLNPCRYKDNYVTEKSWKYYTIHPESPERYMWYRFNMRGSN
jgi:hypothetical protein